MMDNVPYYAPTYFPASYFYSAPGPATSSNPTGLLPYNAPAYFAPAYFYGPSATAPSGLLPYNAPSYFAPTYFYGPTSTVGTTTVVTDPIGGEVDLDPYLSLLGLISSTGAFEEVIFGASTQRSQAGADTYPLAVVTPKGWEEADDVDPTSIVRRVTFSITIVVKGEDDLPQFDRLERLSTVLKKAVDRSNLGGTVLPALTRIRSGHFDYSSHYPEQSIALDGEFSMLIEASTDPPASS